MLFYSHPDSYLQVGSISRTKAFRLAIRAFIVFLFVLCNTGCRKKIAPLQVPNDLESTKRLDDQQITCIEDASAYADIFLPLGITKYRAINTQREGQGIIEYNSTFMPTVIKDFYELDMERLGWRLLSQFNSPHQHLLLFDKPQAWCIVTITQSINTTSNITLFVDTKTL